MAGAQVSEKTKTPSGAWQQFQLAKRQMLAEYRVAKAHAPSQVHHTIAAAALFRTWLESFLPKRFGVTGGYIRGQMIRVPPGDSPFDVIIYDQLSSPTLWVESSPDQSSQGRSRMVPAEHVRAVIDVKARFSTDTAMTAVHKFGELKPLMDGIDVPGERYPTYLQPSTALATVFFELSESDREDMRALREIHAGMDLPRGFYGALILSSEGLPVDATGLTAFVRHAVGTRVVEGYGDLMTAHCKTKGFAHKGRMCSVRLDWMETNFARFAFDLIAIAQGTFERGRVSSFFGLDLSKIEPPKATPG